MSKVAGLARRMKPHALRAHVVDPWAFAVIVAAFGAGVFLVSWHSNSLRLDVEGTNLAWVVLVGFGMTYHGEWGGAWRTGAGMIAGAFCAMAGLYGSMSLLPVNAMWVGAGLGVCAVFVAFASHMLPRLFTFAGSAVGFGVGIAAARSFPFRPTTPAEDLFTLMLGVGLAIVMGTFGSMALRAAIVWVGVRRPGDAGSVHAFPSSDGAQDEAGRPARTRAAR